MKIDPRSKSDSRRSEDKTDPKIKIEDAATQQERLKNQFDEFKQRLFVLAQKLENSTKPEDREKSKVLRKAIEKASEEGVETRFSTLIELLRGGNTANNTEQLQDILSQNERTSPHPPRHHGAASQGRSRRRIAPADRRMRGV